MASVNKEPGYDPIALAAATEKVVVRGNQRKYVQLGRRLRFYGGSISATEVGCNLRCKFCFSDKPVWKPGRVGKFYTPQAVFDGLDRAAQKYNTKIISASASEGTIGQQHLMELLALVDQSEYTYVLETNGMILGAASEYVRALKRFKNLHVRVSMKGCTSEEFHKLTGAKKSAYDLPFKALEMLIQEGISCNACLSVSFSDDEAIKAAKRRLYDLWPGLLKSLEVERIKLFPKVRERLREKDLLKTVVSPIKWRSF
ncbi:MAG: radical SAM protein [Gammaproteobacteria bacterium]|nr:radical SAM protein [Gammaproteobacteria bacterium]